jgi:hypothetical protein
VLTIDEQETSAVVTVLVSAKRQVLLTADVKQFFGLLRNKALIVGFSL